MALAHTANFAFRQPQFLDAGNRAQISTATSRDSNSASAKNRR
jgi:hypothetical protein